MRDNQGLLYKQTIMFWSCYFLLNYAYAVELNKYRKRELTVLLFSFELCTIKQEKPCVAGADSSLLFSFELCLLYRDQLVLVDPFHSLAIFF